MSTVESGIECIGVIEPFDLQTGAGDRLSTTIKFGQVEDVFEAQVTTTGNAQIDSVSDPKWFLADRVFSGTTEEHTNEEVWLRIVEAGEAPPFEVDFNFTSANGAKSIGIQGWRYCNIEALVGAIQGTTVGEPINIWGFGYSYVNLLEELLRSPNAYGYSYVKLIQRLVALNAMGYSYSKVIQLLESKNGYGYSYADVQTPP